MLNFVMVAIVAIWRAHPPRKRRARSAGAGQLKLSGKSTGEGKAGFPAHSAASPPHSLSNMREYSPEANNANRKFAGGRLWYGSDSI